MFKYQINQPVSTNHSAHSPLSVVTKPKNQGQSVPYLSVAQAHEGQTHTEDKHPCFLHLGRQLFPSYFLAVPTFLSVLLYLAALHNADADNC